MALAGRDPGVGSTQQLSALQNALRSETRYGGMDYCVLDQLARDIEPKYLARWATALRTIASRPRPERAARGIAAHLLDAGFSAEFLHRWWSFKLRHEPGIKTLADIVDDAHALALQPTRQYKVLVAFSAFTKRTGSMPSGWLDAPEVSRWLRERKLNVEGIRQKGGILMVVTGRDALAAVDAARERPERLAARVLVGSDREFDLLPTAWVDGEDRAFRLVRAGRAVDVHALERNYVQPRIMCSPARRSLTIMRRDGPLRQVAAPGRCA